MKKVVLCIIILLGVLVLLGYASAIDIYNPNYNLNQNLNEKVVIQISNAIFNCQGYSITGTGSGDGILVQGKQNVTIKNCKISNFNKGIYIQGSKNISVLNSEIKNNVKYGIDIGESSNNKVMSNNITNNKNDGLVIYGSNYNIVNGNNIINNSDGMWIHGSKGNNITVSTINKNNNNGIYNEEGNHNIYESNKINENKNHGVYIIDGDDIIVDSNVIKKNMKTGVVIQVYNLFDFGDSERNIISSNVIKYNTNGIYLIRQDGGPWGEYYPKNTQIYNNLFNNPTNIYSDQSKSTKWDIGILDSTRGPNIVGGEYWAGNFWSDYTGIDGDGDGIGDNSYAGKDRIPLMGVDCGSKIMQSTTLNRNLDDCEGTALNITANNVILDCQGYRIVGNRSGNGIMAISRQNITIKNCKIYNFTDGIRLLSTYDSKVYNNVVNNNSNTGINVASYSLQNYIGFNNVNFNSDGISIRGGDYNVVTNNDASFNKGFGIKTGGFGELYNNFTNNIANNNQYSGIHLSTANYSLIFNNTAKNNKQRGIYLSWSSRNVIRNNIILNNTEYSGIYLQYNCTNNIIYNNFLNNSINAFDDSIYGNYWNTTKTSGTNIANGPYIGGNYWGDYNGLDNGQATISGVPNVSGDGLGDTKLPHNSSNNIKVGGDFLPLIFFGAPVTPTCDLITCSALNLTTTPTCTNTQPPRCCVWNGTSCLKNCSGVNCADYMTSISCVSGQCCDWDNIKSECFPKPGLPHQYCKKDGIVDFSRGEQCDPGNATKSQNLSGETCVSQGYEAGTLSCTQLCRFNYGLCSGVCESTSEYSKWTDTDESSEENCRREINGDIKKCCPSGETCREVDENGDTKWICLQEGIYECKDYRYEDECDGFDTGVARNSMSRINSNISCGGQINGNYVYCKCEWDSGDDKCEPAYELRSVLTDPTTSIGSCSYSYTEGECDALGFRIVTYTASGTAAGCSGSNQVRSPCFAATEIPFIGVFGLLISIGLLIGYYIVRKK